MNQQNTVKDRFHALATQLVYCRNAKGYWDGQLSSSALGVAVSVIAFQFYDKELLQKEIYRGVSWLVKHANPDGGYGDSPESISNVSTSLLCFSALYITRHQVPESERTRHLLMNYLKQLGIDVESQDIATHILQFYKNDYTFSVPILTTCALCGIPDDDAFDRIPQLPFELALLPGAFYRFLHLNVVSYAIPALVAVGIVIFKNKPSGWLMKMVRKRSIPRVMRLLEKIMPHSGGFLEAIPLTAFVVLSMIKSGCRQHVVVEKGIDFLRRTQRKDGSWPIDVDLSTWVTTLAVKSFRDELDTYIDQPSRQAITNHLLSLQNQSVHPFNGSDPGGWGWTSFSGSVPDGDDTPGAILALLILNKNPDNQVSTSVMAGCDWLMKLQNRDGGFPTFSRGWGKLPFDQSCADLTGHSILALAASMEALGTHIPAKKHSKYKRALDKAIQYLMHRQQPNGAWHPLWFGNQHHVDHLNPVYGTARVAAYLIDAMQLGWVPDDLKDRFGQCVESAQAFLMTVQNADGSWGGDAGIQGSIEETALAVSALAENPATWEYWQKGLVWLEHQDDPLKAAPIGLYFASLWYAENMYPLVMCTEALARTALPEPSFLSHS